MKLNLNSSLRPDSSIDRSTSGTGRGSLIHRAIELHRFITAAESHTERIRSVMFAEGQSAESGAETKGAVHLEGLLDQAVTRIAELAGSLATISERLDPAEPSQIQSRR